MHKFPATQDEQNHPYLENFQVLLLLISVWPIWEMWNWSKYENLPHRLGLNRRTCANFAVPAELQGHTRGYSNISLQNCWWPAQITPVSTTVNVSQSDCHLRFMDAITQITNDPQMQSRHYHVVRFLKQKRHEWMVSNPTETEGFSHLDAFYVVILIWLLPCQWKNGA